MLSLNKISFGSINDTKSYAKLQMNNESVAYAKLNLNDIIQVDFPENQYIRKQTTKKQIVLHHTVSGPDVISDISWWKKTPGRIATPIIVGRDGKIYQCFSTLYWAYHIGTNAVNNTELEKASIGVEIDSWGGLVRYNKQWFPAKWNYQTKKYIPNLAVPPVQNVQVYEQGFRGFYAFEKYTDEQIEAVRKLLVYWNDRYVIPLTYNDDMWTVSDRALSGESGVWTHVSYREDKSDCHPDEGLVQMLKSLTK